MIPRRIHRIEIVPLLPAGQRGALLLRPHLPTTRVAARPITRKLERKGNRPATSVGRSVFGNEMFGAMPTIGGQHHLSLDAEPGNFDVVGGRGGGHMHGDLVTSLVTDPAGVTFHEKGWWFQGCGRQRALNQADEEQTHAGREELFHDADRVSASTAALPKELFMGDLH